MSGRGTRFSAQGYTKPKPLIEVFGKPMIQHVLENLGNNNTYTLCVLKEHFDADPNLFTHLGHIVERLNIVFVDKVTRGAAETCLLAKNYIDPENILTIANCDQWMKWYQKDFENSLAKDSLDGSMFIFDSNSNKNSYVEVDEQGIAIRTTEKQVISPYATTGIYVWTKARDFIWAAEKMIREDIRVNNEFYVCPVYNQNIEHGSRIGIYKPQEHWPIGTPEDLEYFIKMHPKGV